MLPKKEMDEAINALIDSAADFSLIVIEEEVDTNINRDLVRDKLKRLLNSDDEIKRIDSGLNYINDSMERHLAPVEVNDIKDNWVTGLNNYIKTIEESPETIDQNTISSFQILYGITDETYEKFYAIGIQYFEQKMFSEAADVFYVLAFLNGCRFNVWVSLGLCELQCARFESALNAFAMAAIADVDSPLPYMYSAQCCIQMSDNPEAELYLELAEDKISQNPQLNEVYITEFQNLKKSIK